MTQANLLDSEDIDTPAIREVEDLLDKEYQGHREYQEYVKWASSPPQTRRGIPDESSSWELFSLFSESAREEEITFSQAEFFRLYFETRQEILSRKFQEILKEIIFSTETYDQVLDILLSHDLDLYVRDFRACIARRQEELEENEYSGIILQSLQSWAWFLIDYAQPEQLPYAKIDADFDGCVELSWRLSGESMPLDPDNEYYGNGRGLVHVTFFPSYLNYLSIFSGAYGDNRHRIGFDGWFSHTKTKQTLSMFAERLQSAKRSAQSATSCS